MFLFPSASAAAASSSPASLRGPTLEQRAALVAVPAGMVSAPNRAEKKKKRAFIAKLYNIQASRPFSLVTRPTQTITVTMNYAIVAFTTSTTVPTLFGVNFSLALFSASTAYTSLFDAYRMVELEVWLESNVIASPSVSATQLASCIDLDDSNTPANADDVFGRQGNIVSETTTGHYHRWAPHMAIAAYSGAFTSYSNVPATWIDCASPNVQHYGLKAATANADGVARAIQLNCRATVQFRGPGI